MLEGSFLTLIRTGALSGVAIKYFARENAKVLGVIGTGEQAKGLCEAVVAARDIEEFIEFIYLIVLILKQKNLLNS
ncbi:hypothetical protein [Viridibacillus arvi]|uniref:hypothetical protein n=1 Tax=Viridibacillus arvi TaxID=263475 RepID=UPI003D2B2849